MQNPIQKFRQNFAQSLHTFPTYQCLQKSVWDFFILFTSWVICKNQKDLVSTHSFFYLFINNSRSKQYKKNPAHAFLDIVK